MTNTLKIWKKLLGRLKQTSQRAVHRRELIKLNIIMKKMGGTIWKPNNVMDWLEFWKHDLIEFWQDWWRSWLQYNVIWNLLSNTSTVDKIHNAGQKTLWLEKIIVGRDLNSWCGRGSLVRGKNPCLFGAKPGDAVSEGELPEIPNRA